MAMWSPFVELAIPATASDEEVRKAFRVASLKAHPDKGGTAEQMLRVQEARTIFDDEWEKMDWLRRTRPYAVNAKVVITCFPKLRCCLMWSVHQHERSLVRISRCH